MKMYLLRVLASYSIWHECAREEHMHFAKVRRAIHVNEPGDVLVRKVAEERDLAQDAFCKRDLLQRTGDHLDRDGLPRDVVRRRAGGGNKRGAFSVDRGVELKHRSTYITKPYAPEPSSRMSFHRFSTWNTLPKDDMSAW